MATARMERKRACVTGATGYVGSMLVKSLLEKGYAVNATVRDPANSKKVAHVLNLQVLGDLKIFKADLTEEGSFDDAINGCDFVFHVATPVSFQSTDPENDMIKPAINGTLEILKSCVKAKTAKRVVYTSSVAAVARKKLTGTGHLLDEESWSDVEYLTSEKPLSWLRLIFMEMKLDLYNLPAMTRMVNQPGYGVSKTLAEKAAWKFSKENSIDLITINPGVITGPSLTPEVPGSVSIALSLLTGNEFGINFLKNLQLMSGSISIVHVEDVCRAHIFVAENESASGRYICCAANTRVPDLAKFLSKRYPPYNVLTDFGDFPANLKSIFSSEKLIKAGFSYNYGMEEMYDESVEYSRAVGLLAN
ncbi:anthocyanidin reductase ((2S)-flavan-3-ol-forming)-like isoform X2 [Magnolia sinica]|uniref:anthocyanidin reductase ((2S)-flavan-3-ol-forming)-like isoform X2 n=1 Tax=Magnolia sinica TaxID=86752 RepID=UPI00265B3E1A|nr:anthocyanidin reductase ((2S)-flavan-3-ol-forming)-like isoform X2 [Magnolia sinica]